MILLLIAVFAVFVFYVIQKKQYEKTEYYTQTKTPYFQMIFDKGRLGEFYTYKNLKTLKGYKKYLFNLYLPKANGETTELDVVLLHESGKLQWLDFWFRNPAILDPDSAIWKRQISKETLF